MKKSMIALGAVAFAASVQAASLNWGSANYSFVADNSGTPITTQAGYDGLMNGGSIVLCLLEDGDFSKATVLVGNSGGEASFKTSGGATIKYGVSSTFAWDYADKLVKNGDILGVMYKDKDGNLSKLKYVGGDDITSTYTVTGLSGDDSVLDSFKFTTAGTSSAKVYFTTQSVPEPTSGLLLLLGIGAMALRRRRA